MAYLNRAMLQVKAKDDGKRLHRADESTASASNHWSEFVLRRRIVTTSTMRSSWRASRT